jgi:glucose/arabinose dehydrogenase
VRPAPALLLLVAGLAVAGLAVARPAGAAVDWPQPVLAPFVSGLTQPVYVTHAGDQTGRLFVVERAGRIRIIRNGALLATPFLDITSRVQSGGAEQGLLSVAFPPGYGTKGYFYVYYTRLSDSANVIARYRLSGVDRADAGSETVILPMADTQANHNGGIMVFGRDGYLYVGTGDGGGGGDTDNNAQNRSVLLGKILRLDVESAPSPGQMYVIPATNPNLGPGTRREIWAYGLRNPWRISFDRQTGDLYIADVGQGAREEVDFQPAASAGGENYGWRVMEGTQCYPPGSSCDPSGLTPPVVDYSHALGCSVTGGYVYRGTAYPRMRGVYFYGDYCSGRLWGLTRDGGTWTSQELLATGPSISSFGEDEAGELFLVDYGAGAILRVTDPSVPSPPTSTPSLFRKRMPVVPQRAGVS